MFHQTSLLLVHRVWLSMNIILMWSVAGHSSWSSVPRQLDKRLIRGQIMHFNGSWPRCRVSSLLANLCFHKWLLVLEVFKTLVAFTMIFVVVWDWSWRRGRNGLTRWRLFAHLTFYTSSFLLWQLMRRWSTCCNLKGIRTDHFVIIIIIIIIYSTLLL